jgi:hypothetical protein
MELLPDGKMVLDEQDTVGVLALIYAKTRLSTFTPQRTRLYQRVTPTHLVRARARMRNQTHWCSALARSVTNFA